MKKIGIIGAMPVEIEIIKNELEDCFVENHGGVDYRRIVYSTIYVIKDTIGAIFI